MAVSTAPVATGTQLGYARVSTGHQSLDQQVDALTGAGVNANRVYSDKLSGMSTREQRPGLAALLDYAREGDAIVVIGIDHLGRNAAVRRPGCGGYDSAARTAPAGPTDAVGMDRQGSHPRSHRCTDARAKGFGPAYALLVEP